MKESSFETIKKAYLEQLVAQVAVLVSESQEQLLAQVVANGVAQAQLVAQVAVLGDQAKSNYRSSLFI